MAALGSSCEAQRITTTEPDDVRAIGILYMNIYEQHLDANPAKLCAVVADFHAAPGRHGLWRQIGRVLRRAAGSDLARGLLSQRQCGRGHAMLRGIKRGDTVAIISANIPEMFEAHYAVPMAGAVLNAINIRLDAATIAFILEHGEASMVIVDKEFGAVTERAHWRKWRLSPTVVHIDDATTMTDGKLLGEESYEDSGKSMPSRSSIR